MKNSPTIYTHWLFLLRVVLLAILYFISGQASFFLSVSHSIVTLVIFVAEGFALAFVILWGESLCVGVFLGQLVLALVNGLTWQASLGIAIINSVEALLGAYLFRRFSLTPSLNTVRDLTGLLILVFFVLQPFSATLGISLLHLSDVFTLEHWATAWLSWWFGNALGQIIITPLLLTIFSNLKNLKQILLILSWLPLVLIPIAILAVASISSNTLTIVFTVSLPMLIFLSLKGGIPLVCLMTLILSNTALFLYRPEINQQLAHNDISLLLDLNTHLLTFLLTGQFISVLLLEFKQLRLTEAKTSEQLQRIAEHFPGIICEYRLNTDGSDCFPYASQGIEKLYGMTAEQVKYSAEPIFSKIHPDDIEKVASSIQLSAKNFTPWQCEYRMCFDDADVRWFSGRSLPIQKEDGAILWHGFIEDITEIKKRDIEYQAIIEASTSGFWCIDFSGRFLKVNSAACEMLGYSEQELLNMSIPEIEAVEHPEETAEHMKTIIQMGHDHFETQHRCKTGKVLDVEINVLYIKELGQRFFAFVTDITERKQMEEALLNSHNELQHYFNQPFIGMLTSWRNKKTVHVNQRFCDIVGYSREEMQTIDWGLITHPDDLAPDQVYVDQALRGEIDAYQIEKRYIHKDGHIVYVELKVNCVRDKKGNFDYFIGMVLDITERKYIEAKLKDQQTLLKTAQKVARMGYYITNVLQNTWANDEMLDQIFGIDDTFKRDISNWQTLIHPDDVQRVTTYFYDTIKRKEPYPQIEYRIMRPSDQELRWVAAWGQNFYDVQGQVYQQVGMIQDITERKLKEQELQETSEQLQLVLEGGHLGFWDWNLVTGEVQRNSIWAEMLGYTYDEIKHTAQQWEDFVYVEDRQRAWQSIYNALEGKTAYHELEYRMLHKDGSIRWILDHASVVQRDKDGKPTRMSGTHTDITHLKELEEQLRESERFFQLLAQINPVGIYRTDSKGQCIFVNPTWCEIVGLTQEQALGNGWASAVMLEDRKKVYEAWSQTINQNRLFALEYRFEHADGKVVWVYGQAVAIHDETGKILGYVGTITDITERKLTEERINQLAFYDSLTKLPNRRFLRDRIKHGIDIYHRTGKRMALLMMDLDKFKPVNDNLGHAAGDELLKQVGYRIKARLRAMDMVARLGGDEFVVLIENLEHDEQAAHIADAIIHTLTQPFTINNHQVTIGTSIGIAIHPEHGSKIDDLMDNADIALYHAKEQGRGCFAYFSEVLTQRARERIALETRLRNAIAQQQLRVYLQPQADINDGQLIGAEALVRWIDPIEGMISPDSFIPIAEETGLIIQIGEWVLKETCRIGKAWLDQGLPPITLAVNVSPYQFRRCNINVLVIDILEETGFPADYLELEITESGLMENQEHAMSILNSLRNQGVKLAIDDFGTGYSSLAYLKYFPLDILKIDKAFIRNIPHSQDDTAITSSIIAMAHYLGFKVLAEGVENNEQLLFLKQQNCDMYQGFLCCKPLPVEEFENLLKNYQ